MAPDWLLTLLPFLDSCGLTALALSCRYSDHTPQKGTTGHQVDIL